MQSIPTRLPGLVILEPSVFPDERGFFTETYGREWHAEAGIPAADAFIQDNHSRSTRGVVRGMHFHIGAGVAKLVRCARGRILDVAVDLRRGSPTYGQWEGVELDGGVVVGGLLVEHVRDIAEHAEAVGEADRDVQPAHALVVERGIAWDDPEIAIEWPLP